MDNFILLTKYNDTCNYIKYLQNNAYIIFSNEWDNNNINILSIFLTKSNLKYYIKIKDKYHGILKECHIVKRNTNKYNSIIIYKYILEIHDIHILEFLSMIYQNNIKPINTNNDMLYNDYIKLYNNQNSLIKKNKIFI